MTPGNCPNLLKKGVFCTRRSLLITLVFTLVTSSIDHSSAQQNFSDALIGGSNNRELAILEANQLISEGEAFREQGDLKSAVGVFRAAFRRLPEGESAGGIRERALQSWTTNAIDYADELVEGGYIKEARFILEDARGAHPDHPGLTTALELLSDPEEVNPADTAQHRQEVSRVEKLLAEGETMLQAGAFDDATLTFSEVLTIDRYNKAARNGLNRAAEYMSDHARANYDTMRSEAIAEVGRKWEGAVPKQGGGGVGGGVEPGQELVASASESLSDKLNTIIVPEVNLQNVNLDTAVTYLAQISQAYDPEGVGINFVLNPGGNVDRFRPITLNFQNVPLVELLRYITEMANATYQIDSYMVRIVSVDEADSTMLSRTYIVPPNFLSTAQGPSVDEAADPFAPQTAGLVVTQRTAQEFLEQHGIPFPDGSSAAYTPTTNQLVVRNTFQNLQAVDALVDSQRMEGIKQLVIQIRMLNVSQENLQELSFDWLLDEFTIEGGNDVLGGGGTTVTDEFGNNFSFRDSETGEVFAGRSLTSGLRSGPGVLDNGGLDRLIGSDRVSGLGSVINRAPGAFSIAGQLTDPQFQAILRGLHQKKATDVIVAPEIVVQSGQRASIQVGEELIYPTDYDPPEIPQEVGTSSQGGFPVTPAHPTTFETRELGLNLEVDPVIGPDNYTIHLNLAPEFVTFDGFINYGSPIEIGVPVLVPIPGLPATTTLRLTDNQVLQPVFSVTRLVTPATIYDGATLVLGALHESRIDRVNDKVPILGDLPMIGRLFRSQIERERTKVIIFFLTAKIIDATGARVNRLDSFDESLAP